MYPSDYKFNEAHYWLCVEKDKIARIGISDFAQQQLGEITFIELLKMGTNCKKNDAIGTLESVFSTAEFYAAVPGTIVEINNAVNANPILINQDPHGKGWLVKIKFSNASDLVDFMDSTAYEAYLENN